MFRWDDVMTVVGWSAVEEDVGMVPLTLLTVPPHFS